MAQQPPAVAGQLLQPCWPLPPKPLAPASPASSPTCRHQTRAVRTRPLQRGAGQVPGATRQQQQGASVVHSRHAWMSRWSSPQTVAYTRALPKGRTAGLTLPSASTGCPHSPPAARPGALAPLPARHARAAQHSPRLRQGESDGQGWHCRVSSKGRCTAGFCQHSCVCCLMTSCHQGPTICHTQRMKRRRPSLPTRSPVKLRGPGKRSTSARSSRPPLGATRDASAAVRGGGSAALAGSSCCRAESAPGPEMRTTAMAARPWALLSAKMVSRAAAQEKARAHGSNHG